MFIFFRTVVEKLDRAGISLDEKTDLPKFAS